MDASGDGDGDAATLQEQSFGSVEYLCEMLAAHDEHIDEQLAFVTSKLDVYLTTTVTRSILFKPVRVNVYAALTQLRNVVETQYSPDDSKRILLSLDVLRGKVSQHQPYDQ